MVFHIHETKGGNGSITGTSPFYGEKAVKSKLNHCDQAEGKVQKMKKIPRISETQALEPSLCPIKSSLCELLKIFILLFLIICSVCESMCV